jgi:hypothetical protein
MNPSHSYSRLLRLVSSLPRSPRMEGCAIPCPNHHSAVNVSPITPSRRVCTASRGSTLLHTRSHTCLSRLHPRLYPGSGVHRVLQTGCGYSTTTGTPGNESLRPQPSSPEMPDHLDSKEKAIFQKLAEGLNPVALEVSSYSVAARWATLSNRLGLGADEASGSRR